MKQIVCPNCGANDFVIKDGYKFAGIAIRNLQLKRM